MGLLAGTTSFVVFDVLGDLPEMNSHDYILKKIQDFTFVEIDETHDEYSVGWVSMLDMFDSKHLKNHHMSGHYVTISLRIDERKVPSAVLKKFVAKEERKIMKDRDIPKLGRSMKADIRIRIGTELTRKANPVPTVFEICWNMHEHQLMMFSTDKKCQAVLEDYFKETFDLMLRKRVPYTVAEHRLSLSQNVLGIDLEKITECSFV